MSEAKKTGASPDPRTAEVLRALERARGMMSSAGSLNCAPAPERSREVLALCEEGSTAGPDAQDLVKTLCATARLLERALVAVSERQADLQRGQDRAVCELRESVQGLKQQTDVLAGWYAWAVRHVAAWGLILGLLVAGAVVLAWRMNAVAVSTHSVLEQILENQARMQATKSGKRR